MNNKETKIMNVDYCNNYIDGYEETSLASVLDVYIGNLDLRWDRMNGVLDNIFSRYENPKVLDLALGSGHDTIALLKRGFNVVSNEVDKNYLSIAKKRAKKHKVALTVRIENWKNIIRSDKYKNEEFDVVFALGNSFPNYLLFGDDRKESLRGFWQILKPGGTLFFDTRNFDFMLSHKEKIVENPERNFVFKGNTTFLNKDDVRVFPTYISKDKIHLCFKLLPKKQYAHLDVWPATEKDVLSLIGEAIGKANIKIHYDYLDKKPEHYDFVQYELIKPL